MPNMEKREFSADQRRSAADKGQAMPDGSFPIVTAEDLHNAIQAIGRAKDRSAAMAHIRSRARALGMTDALPEEWRTNKSRGTAFDIVCKTKVEPKHGVVHAWAIVSDVEGQPYVDFHGDWIPQDSMYEAALDFAEKSRAMKIEHEGGRVGSVPFLYPMTDDVKKALELDGKYAGLAASLRPDDKGVLDRFASGEFTGLSIGGKRILDEVVDRATGKKLGEIDCASIAKTLGKDATPEAVDEVYEHELDLIAKAAKLARNQLKRVMRKFLLWELSAVGQPAQEPADARLVKHRLFELPSEKVAFSDARPESDVKQEPTTMADNDALAKQLTAEIDTLKAKITAGDAALTAAKAEVEGLKKKLAREQVVKSLTGDDRDHYLWLTDDGARDAFVAKSRADRDAEVKAATYYKAKDGQVFRLGEERAGDLAKRIDAQNAKLDEQSASIEDADIAKSAGVIMKHLPEPTLHVVLMKAVRTIADKDQRAKAEALLKTIDAAYATLFKNRGVNTVDGATGDDALGKLGTIAKSLKTADPKLTDEAAFAKAAEANPALYTQYLEETGRRKPAN